MTISRRNDRASLGYWIGVPYWNQGYATEAARAVLRLGFTKLGLNRIEAHHFVRNPASGRVMQKAGMRREARLSQYEKKGAFYEDVQFYLAIKDEWERRLVSGRRPAVFGSAIPFLSMLVNRSTNPDGRLG